MPPEGIPLVPHNEVLTYEEIYTIVQLAAEMGITKVRLSGGEPLVRLGLANLIGLLSQVKGIDDISLTTNGVLLALQAAQLKEAGLHRVNISLDSLDREKLHTITGYDKLPEVLKGIEAAHKAGLEPVKINTVVIRGINDAEVMEFARLTQEEGWHVRFIELMPLQGSRRDFTASLVSADEIKERLTPLGSLESCLPSVGNGPAKYYRLPQAKGSIGFITPISEHFCFGCNRLRLTAEGRLLPCLLSEKYIDLREPLRRGASAEELGNLIQEAVDSKPMGHRLREGLVSRLPMSQIGG